MKHHQNRGQQQVPWTILARYGCEEHSFSLEIPSEIEEIPELSSGEYFELSSNAFEFLFSLALNASSRRFLGEDNDSALGIKNIRTSKIDDVLHNSSNDARKGGNMTWRDLEDIVAVMPTVTHPWCYPPICQVLSSTSILLFYCFLFFFIPLSLPIFFAFSLLFRSYFILNYSPFPLFFSLFFLLFYSSISFLSIS